MAHIVVLLKSTFPQNLFVLGKIIVIPLLLVLSAIQSLTAQEFYFKNYKIEDGLSHNTILCSLQDQRGFLWFGTKDGLNRFDGYAFKVYQHDADQPSSLGSNFVECLHEYNNKLWVGTDSGLFIYDEGSERFEVVEAANGLPILDIENDDHGNLWFVAGSTLVKYSIETKEAKYFLAERYFNVEEITKTLDGKIWAANNHYLYSYERESDSFSSFALEIADDNGLPFKISKIFPLDETTLLIGSQDHGAYTFNMRDQTTKKLLPATEDPLYIRDFCLKGDNELWMSTESGLYVYYLKEGTYQNVKKSYYDPYALSDNALYSLTVDKEGGVWIGSYFGGVNYYPKQYAKFDKYFPKPGKNTISGNAIREIQKDEKGNLWIGTEDASLNKLNASTRRFEHFKASEAKNTLSYYNIHALLPRGNELWIGTFQHGLDILDINKGNVIKHYSNGDAHGLSNNFIYSLYEDKAKNIYAITASGIQLYDFEKDSFKTLDNFSKDLFYTCFMIDNDGVQWAGTYWDGLYSFNPKTNRKRIFKHNLTNPNSISGNGINSIFQDSKGTLWVTTENGLNQFISETQEFKTYTMKDGFPSNVFYAIIEGENNKLWISTSNGLVEFDPASDEKRVYTKADGLLSNQFNYNSAFKDSDGTLYFGSVAGMISFNPKSFSENSYRPPIYLTGLEINNQEIPVGGDDSPLSKSVTLTNQLKLQPDQSTFSINFSALGFTAPDSREYWYMLQGLDDNWIHLKKQHSISFTQLPAGKYSFKVKSKNNNGVWSMESAPLLIEVLPVFWKSNLAYFLYICFGTLFAFLGFRLYHQRVKAQNVQKIRQLNNKKEKEIYKAKIEFFTNISHEIRTPLTLIKSPLEKVIQKIHELPSVSENLSIIEKNTNRLLDLVNQLLDFRKAENERVDLTFVETDITGLLENILDRFSESIDGHQLVLQKNFEETAMFAFVDAEALRKILSNLIGNAIKYANKNIYVSLSCGKKHLTLCIKNDGPLIPVHLKDKIFEPFYRVSNEDNKAGTGIGLALARSLTEMHNGTLTLDPSDGTMNSFVLKLPIHQEKEFKLRPKAEINFESELIKSEEDVVKNGKASILLVEDSEELLDFIAKELKEDFFVLKASNGESALKILEEENVQLVVSDVMMPGMDGFKLCKKIKTNLETSHIPLILLTSKSTMVAKMEGLESGADAYVEKPFSINHLKVHIENLIENRRHILAHYASSPLAHIRSIANTKTDETFIKKLDDIICENMADHNLNVETLSEIMHMSRSTLYRKIKDISNLSPNELINVTRLKRSVELLGTGNYRVFEVAEMVGYNSATSFGRNFQKQFEMTPTEYMKENT